ncbi:MAG: ABA4-like family protein [Candidatus Binatia bacterium]|nr:ABA4-like family protein [Candidatus Binatia bacterium]
MTADTLFTICNNGVLPAWLLLVFAPGWEWTQRIVHGIWIPLLLGGVYTGIALMGPGAPEGSGFGSLPEVMRLFTSPEGALAGWVHYLVFDLFVGAWEVRDARRREISHLWVAPCLVLTLMLGPAGLVAYLLLRFVRTGATDLVEA